MVRCADVHAGAEEDADRAEPSSTARDGQVDVREPSR